MELNQIPFSINNSLTMKDILNEEGLDKLKDIMSYLKCNKCNELMIEPKMCVTCSKNLCLKCQKNNCNHELILSRHLKSILKNIFLKCRGCKDSKDYDYFSLSKHAESCGFFKQLQKDKLLFINSDQNKENINEDKVQTSIKSFSLQSKNLSDAEYQKLTVINCHCGERIESVNLKEAFKQHRKSCIQKDIENKIKESENDSNFSNRNKDTIINEFMTRIETIQKNYYDVSKLKNNGFLAEVNNDLSSFMLSINKKTENIRTIEEEIENYNKKIAESRDYIPNELILSNVEYQRLMEEEKALKLEKSNLEVSLREITNKYNTTKANNEDALNNQLNDYKVKLQSLEVEELWLKEEIATYDPTLINSVFSDIDTCSFCKNSKIEIKKHYCQTCCKRYCAGTCAKICSSNNCSKQSKFICPTCVPRCGLCRKNVFCENCKKSCYYQDCKNIFCPECYKKNSHQARTPTNNCAFFTCENCKVKACLMTSLFCVKCEKRLCNSCLFNDKDHFDILFK